MYVLVSTSDAFFYINRTSPSPTILLTFALKRFPLVIYAVCERSVVGRSQVPDMVTLWPGQRPTKALVIARFQELSKLGVGN